MSKSLEKLADKMIRLSPEEQQKLQLIIKAKLLPKMAKEQQKGLAGSNNPNDPLAPIQKLPNGPRNPVAMKLTRPNYDNGRTKSESDKPPPPGTTSVEQFIENMTVSLGF